MTDNLESIIGALKPNNISMDKFSGMDINRKTFFKYFISDLTQLEFESILYSDPEISRIVALDYIKRAKFDNSKDLIKCSLSDIFDFISYNAKNKKLNRQSSIGSLQTHIPNFNTAMLVDYYKNLVSADQQNLISRSNNLSDLQSILMLSKLDIDCSDYAGYETSPENMMLDYLGKRVLRKDRQKKSSDESISHTSETRTSYQSLSGNETNRSSRSRHDYFAPESYYRNRDSLWSGFKNIVLPYFLGASIAVSGFFGVGALAYHLVNKYSNSNEPIEENFELDIEPMIKNGSNPKIFDGDQSKRHLPNNINIYVYDPSSGGYVKMSDDQLSDMFSYSDDGAMVIDSPIGKITVYGSDNSYTLIK